MKPKKNRIAEYYCISCDFEGEYFCNEKEIKNARQKVINHHKKTGHTIFFTIITNYRYAEE